MKSFKIKKNLILPLISFVAVGVMYLLYFALHDFYPFGGRSIAWCDLEQQYVPLLMELRGIILNGGSLLLGHGGAGMNLLGVFLFFVSSPLSLLSLLVSNNQMIYFINILSVIKLAMCGASASFYFEKLFRNLPKSFNILLSIMYSFSGYAMMYYQNNMWLDMMILFPLLLWSMFRICHSGKWGIYTILLSLAMFMNFYISYMLVIFILIAFGIMLFYCCQKKQRGKVAVKFIAADICSALITAIVWLPSMKQFTSSGRGESSLLLFQSGSFFEDAADKIALIMCTSVIVAAIALMIIYRKNFMHGKSAFFGVMTLVTLVGAFISPANKIWHTGSYQAYPLRYGFIIVLLGLSVCAIIMSDSEKKSYTIKRKPVIICVASLMVFITMSAIGICYSKSFNSYVNSLWVRGKDIAEAVIFGIVSAAVYFILLLSYKKRHINQKLMTVLMSVVILGESFMSFSIYFGNIRMDAMERFQQTADLSGKIDDSEYYRVKSMKRYFYSNMLEGLGFNSIGHYTSLTDRDFLFTAKQLGYSAYWLDISSNGGTLITDAFLNNKYLIGVSNDMNELYEPYNIDDIFKIYKNTVVSDGAVISQTSPEKMYDFNSTERMKSTDFIAQWLYGANENIVQTIEPYSYSNLTYSEENGKKSFEISNIGENSFINYSQYVNGEQELYFDLFSNYTTSLTEPYFEAVSIYVNGKLVEENYPNKRTSGIIDLGTFENQYVSVKISVHKDFSVDSYGLYMLDTEKAIDCIDSAQTAKITLDGNKIRITADIEEGGYVYIPFAYNNGYSAELNGEKAEISEVLGSFMAVKLESGQNELVLTFIPNGLLVGAIIGVVGIALFVLLIFNKRIHVSYKVAGVVGRAVMVLSLAAIAFIYIISSAVWIILQFVC